MLLLWRKRTTHKQMEGKQNDRISLFKKNPCTVNIARRGLTSTPAGLANTGRKHLIINFKLNAAPLPQLNLAQPVHLKHSDK